MRSSIPLNLRCDEFCSSLDELSTVRSALYRGPQQREKAHFTILIFLLGGLFTGVFGKKIASETITKKGGVKKLSDNYFKAFHKTEGRKDYEASGFDYRVGDDNFNTKVREDVKTNA